MFLIGVDFVVILKFEFTSRFKLDHHRKPESTELPIRPSMRLFGSADQRSFMQESNLGPSV